jgi:hypothetical protein
MYLCLSVCLPACLLVCFENFLFFFTWGNPQNNFPYLEEPPLMKMVTGQKNLIAGSAVRWLIIVTKIYLQSTAMHMSSYIAKKNWNTYSCFSYYLTLFLDIKLLNYGDHSSIGIFWMKFPLYLEECWEFFEVLEKY